MSVVLAVDDLRVHLPVPAGGLLRRTRVPLKAVDGVSFELRESETLGVVGESGCGKSTLGRALLRLIEPTAGRILWRGQDLRALGPEAMRTRRAELQIVFQDPLASLDPRMAVGDTIAEPLITHRPKLPGAELSERVRRIMATTGLSPEMINRYPHELSGGQCQRVGIARAMILEPKLIVCDEPVSALDVSIQAQIVNLLIDLQRAFGLSLLFISHDLAVVRQISHRVLVLYLGKVMEIAGRDAIYERPLHPYTRALIAAVPIPDPRLERRKAHVPLAGEPPSPLDPPSGCVFRTRCPFARPICADQVPEREDTGDGHLVACHRWREI